jgi:hypothetical protein
LSEVGVDFPIPNFVGIGEGVARDPATYTHMVELLALCTKADFCFSEALSVSQLRKCHAEELVEATEGFDLVISVVVFHATAKNFHRKVLHYLSKDKFA